MNKKSILIAMVIVTLLIGTGFASNSKGLPEQVKELQAQMIDVFISLESNEALIKEQQLELDQQKVTITNQQTKITTLEREVASLKNEVNTLKSLLIPPTESQPGTPSPESPSPLNYRVFSNGHEIITDTTPYMFKDAILLTIRGISEAFGISAGYNSTDKSIIFIDSLTTLVLYLDSGKYKLNDQEGTLEVGAMVINGRTFALFNSLLIPLGEL
jgi:hypothetical protein